MHRPRHLTVEDELGLEKSMPAAVDRFEWTDAPASGRAPVVFLGLGPEPEKLPEWFDLPDREIRFLECPAFARQVDGWQRRVPANFRPMADDEFTRDLAAGARVVRYLPAHRAFPSYFAPLSARLALRAADLQKRGRTAWIPASGDDLLCRELAQALRGAGYEVDLIDHEPPERHPGRVLPELLAQGVPDLFLSVNFKGLDPFGLGHAILREAGVQVGIWLVDNPFNLLTAVKSGYWKCAKLFVTDHSFIGPLIGEGARWATHLPLAASPALFESGGVLPENAQGLKDRLIFVGRSEFPDRDRFFAGITVPPELADRVNADADGRRFDYHWWRDRTRIARLWPGNAVRAVGAGAEWAGRKWKLDCLRAAGRIVVFGDPGWQGLANHGADLRGPVDYYAHLPAVYRAAAATLNVTGMQLPAGLTQRHFDVWCAGGFLISDANPGLNIFPPELVDPIRFTRPGDIRDLFLRHREETQAKRELRAAWKECVLADHTYADRVRTIIAALGL
ncbi:MAG: glycosyltransferase [Desulfovibrionaceae bacterium]|nr:glycosyltransferase [Desulfovibrionaceae bacterium]